MRECGPDPNHRRVIARDSGNPGCPFSRALAGFGRVAATSRDFLGQRGHPASHTRFSVICPNDCHTCAMLRGSIAMFCGCSHRLTAAHTPRAREFPLRPINSHVITKSRRRASRGDQDPEGDSRLHTGTQLRIRRSQRASSTSPKVAQGTSPPMMRAPEMGTRVADRAVAAARSAFLFREPGKRDRIERKARRWRASSEARKR